LIKSQGGEWVDAALWADDELVEKNRKIIGTHEFIGTNPGPDGKT
jgi:hypothetical protein